MLLFQLFHACFALALPLSRKRNNLARLQLLPLKSVSELLRRVANLMTLCLHDPLEFLAFLAHLLRHPLILQVFCETPPQPYTSNFVLALAQFTSAFSPILERSLGPRLVDTPE